MEVILLDDVERVGHEGDVLKVADGYARNYLIPRGLAVRASKGALQDLERRRKAIAAREDEKRSKFRKIAEEISGQSITVKARAGQGNRLHGQVTPQMVVEAVKEQLHMDMDRRSIEIAEPIRELGDYLIGVKLYKDVHAQLPVSVVRDGTAEEWVTPPPARPEAEKAEKEAVVEDEEGTPQESQDEAAGEADEEAERQDS